LFESKQYTSPPSVSTTCFGSPSTGTFYYNQCYNTVHLNDATCTNEGFFGLIKTSFSTYDYYLSGVYQSTATCPSPTPTPTRTVTPTSGYVGGGGSFDIRFGLMSSPTPSQTSSAPVPTPSRSMTPIFAVSSPIY
jgi:hypothetical protein